tara:strand:+ start:3053 stop:3811 length:759 start_codon:yes stop_codon:yes gene_type:complete
MGFLDGLTKFAGSAGGGALIGGAITGIASLFGGGAKRREAYRARVEKDRLTGELKELEDDRQTIINPYAGVTDISSMAKDLSNMVSNPYSNLGVATKAADMQIEEADIALANTLDTLRATGASAGGATALAQAALQSKKGVSANIEQQEAQNEKLRAQGESNLQRLQMQEAQRIQNIGMSEAQRLQQADVSGQTFTFEQKERRQMEQLDRKQAQITGQAQAAVAASQGASAIYSSGLSSIGNIAAAYAGNKG